jgi:hypothetical protein
MALPQGGQTSYVLTVDFAVPGQLGDTNLDSRIVSIPAGENINFGILCEQDQTYHTLHPVAGSGSTLVTSGRALAGISVFDVAREQQLAQPGGGSSGSGYYQSGEMVPVLRKGRVYACWDGSGSQGDFKAPLVWHPSTSDPYGLRGVFSNGTSSTSVGSELTTAPAEILEVKDVSAQAPQRGSGSTTPTSASGPFTWICLLEVNLPGA